MEVRETATISEKAAASAKSTGKMLVQYISPGWGSSGYYSPKVLEAAATNRTIPAGTHMYADHPTKKDRLERPERSIRDLFAVTTTDAQLSDDGALVGEVKVLAPYRELMEDLKDCIGVSILGDATDIYEGEADGRSGKIIAGLDKVHSVDFVTRAGRGGQVLSVLESAGVPPLSETSNDTREQLQTQLKDKYGADKVYIYVRDFDDSTCWYTREAPNDSGVYAHAFTQDKNGTVSLTGSPAEVRAKTTYVPVSEDSDFVLPELEDILLEALILPDDHELREVITSAKGAAGTERLMTYWTKGAGAAKVRWGVAGDFNRCVEHLGKYVKDPKGLCSNLHVKATGARPGHAVGEAERVLDLLESGLAVDQDGHSYHFEEDAGWQRIVPGERVLTINECDPTLAVDEAGKTYRYRHGWIPIGHTAEDQAVAKLTMSQRQAYANHRSAGMSHEEALQALVKGHEDDLKTASKMGYKRGTSVHNNHSDALKMAKKALSDHQKSKKGTFNQGPNSANSSNAGAPKSGVEGQIAKLEARKAELMRLPSARVSRSGVSDQIRDLNRQIAKLKTAKKAPAKKGTFDHGPRSRNSSN